LQALESALRTQLDEIIKRCLEQISSNYDSSKTTSITPDQNETAIPSPVLPEPAEMADEHLESNEHEDVPELQPTLDFFTTFDQYNCQPSTPERSGNFDGYIQSNDMDTGLLSYGEKDNIFVNSNAPTSFFCPLDSCNFHCQHGLGQEQGQVLAPSKIIQRTPMLEDWNCGEFLADLGTDSSNFK